MRNYVIITLLLLSGLSCGAQLIVSTQFPSSGMVQKNQLWNLAVTNVTQSNLEFYIVMTIKNSQTGDPVLTASSSSVAMPPGTMILNYSKLIPVQYQQQGGVWEPGIDGTGLLPPGNFLVCYSFISGEAPITSECFPINVQPLSPPQLIFPENSSVIDRAAPVQFSWIPPAPVNIFFDLKYNLIVAERDEIQSPADAIRINIPVLYQESVAASSLIYPASAPELEPGKQYVWQVTALNGYMPVNSSDVWTFTVGTDETVKKVHYSSFTRLAKGDESSYSICIGSLKFAYINETADTSWDVSVFDISTSKRQKILFNMDSIPLKRGLNLVESDLRDKPQFVHKHIYLLELRNSRKELWGMKFEYIKPTSED